MTRDQMREYAALLIAAANGAEIEEDYNDNGWQLCDLSKEGILLGDPAYKYRAKPAKLDIYAIVGNQNVQERGFCLDGFPDRDSAEEALQSLRDSQHFCVAHLREE